MRSALVSAALVILLPVVSGCERTIAIPEDAFDPLGAQLGAGLFGGITCEDFAAAGAPVPGELGHEILIAGLCPYADCTIEQPIAGAGPISVRVPTTAPATLVSASPETLRTGESWTWSEADNGCIEDHVGVTLFPIGTGPALLEMRDADGALLDRFTFELVEAESVQVLVYDESAAGFAGEPTGGPVGPGGAVLQLRGVDATGREVNLTGNGGFGIIGPDGAGTTHEGPLALRFVPDQGPGRYTITGSAIGLSTTLVLDVVE